MLDTPLMMRGISAKYITIRNRVGFVDQLVDGSSASSSFKRFARLLIAPLEHRPLRHARDRDVDRARGPACTQEEADLTEEVAFLRTVME
mgnify:CR=1 FL=1